MRHGKCRCTHWFFFTPAFLGVIISWSPTLCQGPGPYITLLKVTNTSPVTRYLAPEQITPQMLAIQNLRSFCKPSNFTVKLWVI